MDLTRLAKLTAVGPGGRPYDAARVRRSLGLDLPEDYVRFLRLHGAAKINGFLTVLAPGHPNAHVDLLEQVVRQSRSMLEFREMGGRPFYAVRPEPGGLIPWAISDNGDVCWWKTERPDPNTWPVVVCDGRVADWEEYEGTATAFLAAVLERRFRSRILPDDFA